MKSTAREHARGSAPRSPLSNSAPLPTTSMMSRLPSCSRTRGTRSVQQSLSHQAARRRVGVVPAPQAETPASLAQQAYDRRKSCFFSSRISHWLCHDLVEYQSLSLYIATRQAHDHWAAIRNIKTLSQWAYVLVDISMITNPSKLELVLIGQVCGKGKDW